MNIIKTMLGIDDMSIKLSEAKTDEEKMVIMRADALEGLMNGDTILSFRFPNEHTARNAAKKIIEEGVVDRIEIMPTTIMRKDENGEVIPSTNYRLFFDTRDQNVDLKDLSKDNLKLRDHYRDVLAEAVTIPVRAPMRTIGV